MDSRASSDMRTLASYCSRDLEYLTVKCHPCYLLHKFTSAILKAVYIPPLAEMNVLGEICTGTNALEPKFPKTRFIVQKSCLESVDWTIFKELADNLDKYTTTIMDFISKCTVDCMPKKTLRVYANWKPWMNRELHCLLKTRRAAFSKPRKATDPDSVPSHALRSCVDQLSEVFADSFKLSLLQAEVPTCFKKPAFITVPKETHATCLNNYCPVALTSTIMKCE
eukprot:g42532.t1